MLALFAAYAEIIEARGIAVAISLRNPLVVAGVFLGAMTPPIFSALTMLSVTHNAFDMIEEIRRQFREEPGILAGKVLPDYKTCVALAAQGALSSLVLPAFLAVGLPLLVGFVLGPDALGGFLGGAIFTGVIFALLMSQRGRPVGQRQEIHRDRPVWRCGLGSAQSGRGGRHGWRSLQGYRWPSLNTLITVMSLVSSLFAPVIAAFHIF